MEQYLDHLEGARALPPHRAALALWNLPEDWDGTDAERELEVQQNGDLCGLALLREGIEERFENDADRLSQERAKWERVGKAYYYAQHACMAYALLRRALQESDAASASEEAAQQPCVGLSMFTPPVAAGDKATSPYQKLLLHLLHRAHFLGLRRWGDRCYRRMPDRRHVWEEHGTIFDFVYDCTRKEYNFDMWNALTRSHFNHNSAVQYMMHCKDPQFPSLVKDRHLYAFRNGLFHTKQCKFVATDSEACFHTESAACKYFDLAFVDHSGVADWYDVPTPSLQYILETQKFSSEVSRWMYVFIGRLMFELNDLDRWQVIPFLKGCAATGKSTILTQVCKRLYDAHDVGVLSNNIEKKFGLSAFATKYLFIAPEVRDDMGLDQAEFQSMVSGEDMCVARKNLTASQMEWKVPGILAGNQVPSWRDTAGSIVRRLVVFSFTQQPPELDTTLGQKLALEMPAIVQKCARAYLQAVRDVGKNNLRSALPEYFAQTTSELQEDVDSVRNFLKSGKLHCARGVYMPFDEFQKMYNDHCRSNGFRPEKMNKAVYEGPLLEVGARVVTEPRDWPRDSSCYLNKRWVDGVEENLGCDEPQFTAAAWR
jgi:phage/plasmid-associated DNA primase